MKNANQIITSLQYKPQFHKILEYRCINKLKSSLLITIRNYIKKGYIKNNKLFFIIGATLDKHDINNTISLIKTILNSPMLLKSEKFFECMDVKIDDVIFYVDHKPKKDTPLYLTDSYKLKYKERATGDIKIDIRDKKLKELSQTILDIIKENNDT